MRELVVASGNATELLDAVEEVLDEISGAMQMLVQRALYAQIGTAWDGGLHGMLLQMRNDVVGIVSLVGRYACGLQLAVQRQGLRTVSCLAASQSKSREYAQPIDRCVNLGTQPTRGRPRACSPFFFGTCCVLVGTHDGTVDIHFFEVGIVGQLGKDQMPHARARKCLPRKSG